jgi:hypothetical protein
VLGNGSENTFQRQRIYITKELLDDYFVIRALSKENLGLYPESLFGNNSVKKFLWERRITGGIVSYEIRVVSQGGIVLPRPFCYTTY